MTLVQLIPARRAPKETKWFLADLLGESLSAWSQAHLFGKASSGVTVSSPTSHRSSPNYSSYEQSKGVHLGVLLCIFRAMPYNIRKQKCKQTDGDRGRYVLSYTDKKGKKHRACHTSKKKARGQIAAIEGPRNEADELEESLRAFVRSVLNEDTQSLYAMGLEDGHAGKEPELEGMPEYMRGYVAGKGAYNAVQRNYVPYDFQPTD